MAGKDQNVGNLEIGVEINFDKLHADTKKLNKILDQLEPGLKNVQNALNKVEKAGKDVGEQTKKNTSIFGSLFKQMTAATIVGNLVTSAFQKVKQGLVDLVRNSIQASSALTELDSKARVVFGDTFGHVQGQTKAVAEEVGRASTAILQMATDMGAVVSAFGISGPLLDNMSVQLAKLAIDMASFHNSTDEAAFMALRSGITGETEPLKRFGIVLTDANLQLFLMEKGLKRKVSAMNQAQKTALRYEFLMEKTALAQGDAARTADSFANQTRRLEGEMRTLNEEMGKAATPALAEGLGVLSGAIKNTRLFVRALTEDIGTLLTMLNDVPGVGLAKKAGSFAVDTAKRLLDPLGLGKLLSSRVKGRLGGMAANESTAELDDRLNALNEVDKGDEDANSDANGGGAEARKKLLDDLKKIEQDIVKAVAEEAKERLELVKNEREALMLRKEMGVLSDKEQKRLDTINRRLEFKNDLIKEATDAWKDQITELEKVDDKIADIEQSMVDEFESFSNRVSDIQNDSNEDAISAVEKLVREQKEIQERAGGIWGKSADDSYREGQIVTKLLGFDSATLAEGTRRAGMSDAESIEDSKLRKIEVAREEAEAKMDLLSRELAEEQRNRDEIVAMEREKKQAVIDALNERATATATTYALIQTATKTHVDEQIAEYNRLQAALRQSAPLPAAPRGFATGGEVRGPGTGTSDSILAKLSDGEFVVNAAATRAYKPILERINAMAFSLPRFAKGGAVGSVSNSKSVTANFHYHGDAARAAAEPSLLLWNLRKAG